MVIKNRGRGERHGKMVRRSEEVAERSMEAVAEVCHREGGGS